MGIFDLFKKKETATTAAAKVQKTYSEADNRGTRFDTFAKSVGYWTGERFVSKRKDPFVYYTFVNKADARAALLELPYIHEAADSGELICEEIFNFGYFPVLKDMNDLNSFSGEIDAFVVGKDFTSDMFDEAHRIFKKHNGRLHSQAKPEPGMQSKKTPDAGNPSKVVFRGEMQKEDRTYRSYDAPTKADAMAFLAQQHVTKPLFYVHVYTPEGKFGRDKDGFYEF
jgi:hypothetical protein